jgi:lysophospholipase L1-like esterase
MRRYAIPGPCGIVRVTVLAAIVVFVTLPAASQGEKFNPPKLYYLALGDSITYGYQASKARAGLPPSAFNTGYVDVFGARVREIQPGLTTVNYGCLGETTYTFIHGPCVGQTLGIPLHDFFSGTQLDAAVAFLRAHPGDVSPITLNLWGNDVGLFAAACASDLACVSNGAPNLIAQIKANLITILTRLREAAPSAEIIVTGSWDSFLDLLDFADPLFQLLNAEMSSATTAARARFVDPFPVFNPQGDLAVEIQTMCTLTLLCTENDSHPSDAGYRVLGDLVFDVSDYERLFD